MSVLELKIPPVAVTGFFAALMWLLADRLPGWRVAHEWRLLAMLACITVGLAIGLAGVRSFRRAGTTVNPLKPDGSSALVVDGVFRKTRNPMYLGLLLLLLGWGLYLANPFSLLLVLAFPPYMNRFQIRPEEHALQATFGQAFTVYCRRVRRWL